MLAAPEAIFAAEILRIQVPKPPWPARPATHSAAHEETTAAADVEDLRSALPGRHQMEIARVAIVALEVLCAELGWSLPTGAVREGLAAVRWPGRLQWIRSTPPLLLDGAHNPAAARILSEHLRGLAAPRPVLVFAAMKDKDAAAILEILAGGVRAVVLTGPRVERACDPRSLDPILVPAGIPREVVPESGITEILSL